MAKKTEAKKFKKGDSVEWTSQAGGHSKKKVGKVVAVVPTGSFARDAFYEFQADYPESRLESGEGFRKQDSYLVAVPPTGNEKVIAVYTPLTSKLQKHKGSISLKKKLKRSK